MLTPKTTPLDTVLGPAEVQLAAGVQPGPGVGGVTPPVGSIEMWLVTLAPAAAAIGLTTIFKAVSVPPAGAMPVALL